MTDRSTTDMAEFRKWHFMEKTQYLSTPCITLLVQTGSPEGKVGAKGDGGGEGTAIKPKSLAKKPKKNKQCNISHSLGLLIIVPQTSLILLLWKYNYCPSLNCSLMLYLRPNGFNLKNTVNQATECSLNIVFFSLFWNISLANTALLLVVQKMSSQ